jgi:ATP-dependent helicase/nuclease subunit B
MLFAAQDPEGLGEFIPVDWNNPKSRKKKGLVTLEELGKLKRYVEGLLSKLAGEIQKGNIPALPMYKNRDQSPCHYCEYKTLCKRDPKARKVPLCSGLKELIFEEESHG